jgi:hypothetical protein
MIQIPVGVVLLDCFVHPAQDGSNLGRVVPRVPHDRIDRMPEGVSRQATSLPVDSGPLQRLAEPFSPPRLAKAGALIVGEYEALRGKADGFNFKRMELLDRSRGERGQLRKSICGGRLPLGNAGFEPTA